ncbi:serine hydrolase [candidate division KSB1 bacterium]|nr:serine hydrolase [candidate division KSB1 bacterium]
MKKVILIILITSGIFTTSLFSGENIVDQLQNLADEFGGTIGVAAKNLETGESISLNSQQKYPAASVIKVPVMVEFFTRVAEGKIDPQKYVALTDTNKWGGSGVLQYFDGTTRIKLIDAVTLMIILSDNTATNLVIDALGDSHRERLDAVNRRMKALGLENTRLLNKMMSWETKTDSPESIRYGVAVTTPADMALLLEKIARREAVSPAASAMMIDIMKKQQYDEMIPRFLPLETDSIEIAHKTGSVTEVRNDVAIIHTMHGDYVLSIFCDDSQDHRYSADNAATLAGAKASRLIWNHFTGDTGYDVPKQAGGINWNHFPGGRWAKLRLAHAPFPHPDRSQGFTNSKEEYFPFKGHYDEGSAVVIIPDDWQETGDGTNLVLHFHGHRNHVLNVLEQFELPQQLIAARKNAILVLAQGPQNAPDSFGGHMEEPDGLKNFVTEILVRLKTDRLIFKPKVNKLIISAHSGGYRPAAFVLDTGGMTEKIAEVYLFDAFYGQHDKIFNWVNRYQGRLVSIYTEHLAEAHRLFMARLSEANIEFSTDLSENARLTFYPTTVAHNDVIFANFKRYLKSGRLENIE